MILKPMLAATIDSVEHLKFPLYASPKLDGIRCIIQNGVALSRKLKPIPNQWIQDCLKNLPSGLDGELMLEDGDFNDAQSAIMSKDGVPNFFYYVFDHINDDPFLIRQRRLPILIAHNPYAMPLISTEVNSLAELLIMEEACIEADYEGVMLRQGDTKYKFGRSTLKEGALMKLKRFKDAEGVVVGFVELEVNNNPKEKDNLGHSKRSTRKSGKVKAGTLGALLVEYNGAKLTIGTGFTDGQRKHIWENQDQFLRHIVSFKFQELTKNNVPRFPVFKGFRSSLDVD